MNGRRVYAVDELLDQIAAALYDRRLGYLAVTGILTDWRRHRYGSASAELVTGHGADARLRLHANPHAASTIDVAFGAAGYDPATTAAATAHGQVILHRRWGLQLDTSTIDLHGAPHPTQPPAIPVVPPAVRQLDGDSGATPTHAEVAADLALRSWAPSTIDAYHEDWGWFAGWCHSVAGLDDPLDADERVVADYVASMVRDRLAYATIRRRVAGITFGFDVVGRHEAPTRSALVRRVVNDAGRTLGTVQRRVEPQPTPPPAASTLGNHLSNWPPRIDTIGLVDPIDGDDARHDVLAVLDQQPLTVIEHRVPVTGPQAVWRISRALDTLAADPRPDVTVIVRGGGADIDLDIFNHPTVAVAIGRHPRPVITGIGHATNSTAADHAAYLACITPTAAAQTIVASSRPLPD